MNQVLQPSLFREIVTPVYDREMTIQERFEEFHNRNPHVARLLADMALQLKAAGRRQFGIKALFETLRYEYAVRTTGDEFKLNNDFTSRYSRLLMDMHPELNGFFEVREIRSR